MVSWDRGFAEDQKQVWGSVNGGYVLDRIVDDPEVESDAESASDSDSDSDSDSEDDSEEISEENEIEPDEAAQPE